MTPKNSPPKKVLLVGWDSADWKIINELLAEGEMNGVRSLMDNGIHGELSTLQPQVAPMQWTSIATGKMANHHGVHGTTEIDPIFGQVLPISASTRKSKTIWEMLSDHGLRSHLVSWIATQGERHLNGKMVSDIYGPQKGIPGETISANFPLPMPGTYWPEDLADTLNAHRVAPFEIGDDILKYFLPENYKVTLSPEKPVIKLRQFLAESYSTSAAAEQLMIKDPAWDFMAVYFRALDDISHEFMPYHPPQMVGTSNADFDKYQKVVKAAYKAHDAMLQGLIDQAGPDTTVILVSDHGFHSDHLRPKFTPRVKRGNTVWHRDQGILVAKGPGIKHSTDPVAEAGLLDIVPTILHHFDLPVGEDMQGQVIADAFEDGTPEQSIPTWENNSGPLQSRGNLDIDESQDLLLQLVNLGYIDKVSSIPYQATLETTHENNWNLAQAHLSRNEFDPALDLLEACFEAIPDRADYTQALAQTQLKLGLTEEAQATLDKCIESFGNTFSNNILRGQIEIQKGNHLEALDHLELIRSLVPDHPQILEILCRCSVALKQWDTAQDSAIKLLTQDPESFQGHITLARNSLHHESDYETTINHALRAIKSNPSDPLGHLIHGQALAQLKRFEEAIKPLNECLKLNSDHTWAHAILQRCHLALAEQEPNALQQNDDALQSEADSVKDSHKNGAAA